MKPRAAQFVGRRADLGVPTFLTNIRHRGEARVAYNELCTEALVAPHYFLDRAVVAALGRLLVMSIKTMTMLSDQTRRAVALARSPALDLTSRQMAMALIVASDGSATVRGLAERLGVGRPIITRATNTLVTRGLVHRKANPVDGRSIFILPAAGMKEFLAKLLRALAI